MLNGKPGKTDDVRRMYESFPFPYPAAILSDYYLQMFARLLPSQAFTGKRFLDAGCGTAALLAPLAQAYPSASFLGIDMTPASLAVARQAVDSQNLQNVALKRADILTFETAERFNYVMATGVIHHLEDPLRGVKNLRACTAPEGVMISWLYHSLGEFDRLCDRELLFALWGEKHDLAEGIGLMKELGFNIDFRRYGTSGVNVTPPASGWDGKAMWKSLNSDAYMHEIVNTYRFQEVAELFKAGGFDWVALDSVCSSLGSFYIDLAGAEDRAVGHGYLGGQELFETDRLRLLFQSLPMKRKLSALELKLKPCGFQILAGNGTSYQQFGARVRGNVVDLHQV